MKYFISGFLFVILFSACGDQSTSPTEERDDALVSTSSEDTISADTDEASIESLDILELYYLLPSSPYFDTEVGEDSREDRESGIQKKEITKGYLIGGHPMGPSFTMALFKHRQAGADRIMIHRIQWPGDMFTEVFDVLTYKDGKWRNVESTILNYRSEFADIIESELGEEEEVYPVVPENGTDVHFIKWNFSEPHGNIFEYTEEQILFTYEWNGMDFIPKH